LTTQQTETLQTLLQPHVLADIFPQMPQPEFEELMADIAANGLIDPVWLYQDQILDGRHRYRACCELGIKCDFQEYVGDSPASFVLSKNLQRRDLNRGQRAIVSLELEPYLAAEAKERQRQAGSKYGVGQPKASEFNHGVDQKVPQLIAEGLPKTDNSKESRTIAAQLTGTNRQYVSDAKRLKQKAPDLLEQVRTGGMSIPQAMREFNKRNTTPPEPISGKYRVFYADPPLEYGNSGVINDGDNYGRAARHYSSMSIAELCEMGKEVRQASEQHAALFLWVTSPLLAECFEVIKAWGFSYKTQYVWDKQRHNYGHYSSVRHENLLVCTKGSCIPDGPAQQFDSVVSLERSDLHSEKPEYFRQLIETLYPSGNRVELFARKHPPGWAAWGNQVVEEA